jgi:hypothetical protein
MIRIFHQSHIWSYMLQAFYIAAYFVLSFVKFCDPCREIFHAPKIKITYMPYIIAASTLEVRKKHAFHHQKINTPCSKKMIFL